MPTFSSVPISASVGLFVISALIVGAVGMWLARAAIGIATYTGLSETVVGALLTATAKRAAQCAEEAPL